MNREADGPKWLAKLADRAPGILIKGTLLTVLCLLLGSFLDVFNVAGGLMCALLVLAGPFLIVLTLSGRAERHEEPAARKTIRRGAEPGRRRWKADVYDENAYAILDVPQDASVDDIRKAFKKLVQKYHPHAVATEEKERAALVFQRIDQAYQLLCNAQDRARYDAWIEYLGGGEPKLDHACALFKDEAGVAEFDEWIFPRKAARKRKQESRWVVEDVVVEDVADPRIEGTAHSGADPQSPSPPADDVPLPAPGGAPLLVEMPEVIREALGSPNVPKPPVEKP